MQTVLTILTGRHVRGQAFHACALLGLTSKTGFVSLSPHLLSHSPSHHSPLSSLLCSLCWIFRTLLLMRTDWRMYCQLASVDASSVYPHAASSPPDI